MTRSILMVLLAVGTTAGPAWGASFLDRIYGTPEPVHSPRSRAMGGAGAALVNGAYGLVDNPATLALVRGSRVQLAGGLSRVSENRFVPLFDTFDSFVDETAIAVNDDQYGSVSGGVVLDRRRRDGVIVAAGIFDRYDPRYDYFDERRTTATSDDIVAERFIRTRGVLRTASFGVALPVRGGAALGAAFNWYFGTITDRDALVPRASASSGRVTALERKLSGASVTVGGTVLVEERLHLGLAFESRPRLDNDFTRWENDAVTTPPDASGNLDLPYRLQGGVAYRPRNPLRTTFALDIVYMPWSEVVDGLNEGLDLQDTWEARFGLEHIYYNSLPGRVGFRYARSYAAREADRATFTFGVGYLVERFTLDLSGEVGKRISRQEPLFPRAEQGPAVGAGMDRVEDTLVRVTFGAEVGF